MFVLIFVLAFVAIITGVSIRYPLFGWVVFLLVFFFFFFFFIFCFFFNDTATTEIYTLSLHDALPILQQLALAHDGVGKVQAGEFRLARACRDGAVFNDPVIEGAVVFKFQRAEGMGDVFVEIGRAHV